MLKVFIAKNRILVIQKFVIASKPKYLLDNSHNRHYENCLAFVAIHTPNRHCEQVARLAWQSISFFVDCHANANAFARNDRSTCIASGCLPCLIFEGLTHLFNPIVLREGESVSFAMKQHCHTKAKYLSKYLQVYGF